MNDEKTPSSTLDVSSMEVATDLGSIGSVTEGETETLASVAAIVRAELASKPAAPSPSLRALVVELRPELLKARRDGRSWKVIAAAFEVAGFTPDPDTIRIYVSSAAPTRAARAAKQKPAPEPVKVPLPQVAAIKPTASASDPVITTRRDGARLARRVK